MAPKAEKKTWYVQREGWILDEYRQRGDTVEATDAEAQYLVTAGNLGTEKPTDPAPEAEGADALETSLSAETPASAAIAEASAADLASAAGDALPAPVGETAEDGEAPRSGRRART